MIDIGTLLNQRFLLEKELGRGGMGCGLFGPPDELLQRKVAIKLLKEQNGEEVGQKAASRGPDRGPTAARSCRAHL